MLKKGESMMKKKAGPNAKNNTYAYLRVSTIDQDTEKNKADILKFANDKDFGKVHFVEEKVSGIKSWKERKIKNIIDELGDGDKLIVPELSRLGRSMLEIMEIMAVAKEKGIAIYDLKNGWSLNGSIESKVMAMVFSIASEIERDLISKRTIVSSPLHFQASFTGIKGSHCHRSCEARHHLICS